MQKIGLHERKVKQNERFAYGETSQFTGRGRYRVYLKIERCGILFPGLVLIGHCLQNTKLLRKWLTRSFKSQIISFPFIIFRISGNTALNKNIHASVSEQMKKRFAKSKWKVNRIYRCIIYVMYYVFRLLSLIKIYMIYSALISIYLT